MYDKEFEEGLRRINPEAAARAREACLDAIDEEKRKGLIMMAGFEDIFNNAEEKNKREVINMIDVAVESSKELL